MDFGSEMLSVDHADKQEEYWQQSAGQNRNFSKVGTVFVYLLSNFRFDNNLLIVVIWRIFIQRTWSLVALDSGSLYKGRMHGKTLLRIK